MSYIQELIEQQNRADANPDAPLATPPNTGAAPIVVTPENVDDKDKEVKPDLGGQEPKQTPAPAPAADAAPPAEVKPTPEAKAPEAPAATPKPEPATPVAETPPAEVPKPDSAKVLADLKALGFDIENLDQLKPPAKVLTDEEQKAAKEETREKAIQYGLKNNLFKSADLEQYAIDAKRDMRDVALEQFSAQFLAANPDAEEYQIEAAFSDYYAEDEDEDSYRKKIMAAQMKAVADSALEAKYPGILNVQEDYADAVKMEAAAKNYRGAIEKVFNEVPSEVKLKIGNHEYTHVFKKESVDAVRDQFLSKESFFAFGQEAVDEKGLAQAVQATLNAKEWVRATETIAKAHADAILLDKEAGRKGVIPERTSGGSSEFGTGETYKGRIKEQF